MVRAGNARIRNKRCEAASTLRSLWSTVLLGVTVVMVIIFSDLRLNARLLWVFAADVALVVAVARVLWCLPAALPAGACDRLAFSVTRQRAA